jgi:hypothetical protein
MLIDDIADRIAIACPDELDGIIKDMWVDHTHGLLTDNEMETLDEAARARREAIQARCQAARPVGPARRPGNAPRASARPRGARPQRPQRGREKLFGNGRPVPLDREAKNRVMVLARALTHPTEPGKHYGAVTAKALKVCLALLITFHNTRTGLCFPS